ncbi:MAG: hypothetical protein E7662_10655 [Ruminococcaceae bacterium]|nr:hypothetical protein [Oscillospiraceae bacterium]
MRVLFIGNSATYMHDMPATFARLSGAETDQLVKGGCVLSRYADEANELGIRAGEMIRGGYDLVFLQDNGNCISSPEMRDKCISACRKLDRLIRESGARTAIYIRPPYGYSAHGHTHDEQITAFTELFEGIAAELGCDFAPAAAAYRYMEEHHPEITMYHTDNAHTSPAGALLVACLCVLAAGLPLPEEIDGGDVPTEEAQLIRNAAESVYRESHR